MRQFGWIFAGIIAAAVGAAIWAAISYFVHFELAWIAWLIGVGVGGAVVVTAGEYTGTMTGVGAAIIAVAGIFGGKYVSARVQIDDFIQEEGILEISDEFVVSYIADDIAQSRIDAGETLEWPDDEWLLGDAYLPEHYPEGIWDEAQSQWDRGDDAYKAQYREYAEFQWNQNIAAVTDAASEDAVTDIDLFDVLFFGLAILSAWKIGSGMGDEE